MLGGESTMMNILMNKTNMLNSIREWLGKVVTNIVWSVGIAVLQNEKLYQNKPLKM